jgi:hypothetical protein
MIRTSPVSVSTRTSQNCAPRAAFDQRPSRRNLDITRAGRASLPRRPSEPTEGVRDAPCAGQTLLTLTEHGAFFDGLDSPARREQGTGLLLDALPRVLQEDAQAG